MKFEPKTMKDKLGRTVILRSAKASDAKALVEYLKVTAAETPYLIREPEEITLTLEEETKFIDSILQLEKSLMLIAEIDGKHIGNCSLNPVGNYRRYAHRCDVAIALYQE